MEAGIRAVILSDCNDIVRDYSISSRIIESSLSENHDLIKRLKALVSDGTYNTPEELNGIVFYAG